MNLSIQCTFVERRTIIRVCHHCQENHSNVKYHRLFDDRVICDHCDYYMRRNSGEMPSPEHKAQRDAVLRIPKVDHCQSCGISKIEVVLRRHSKAGMMLCGREASYYDKHGKLRPQRREPCVVCESCGISRNEAHLSRHGTLGLVLCQRETWWYKHHGELKPVWDPPRGGRKKKK